MTKQWMNNAVAQGYTALFNQHYNDYATLFNRVRLNLNPAVKGVNLPTSQRLKNYRKGQPDYYLEELYYQFGRYLLIASSRPAICLLIYRGFGTIMSMDRGVWIIIITSISR